MTNSLISIGLAGVEEWREYDFGGRVYRIEWPQKVQFHAGSVTHRVTDKDGIIHCVPAPGNSDCVVRWKGSVIA